MKWIKKIEKRLTARTKGYVEACRYCESKMSGSSKSLRAPGSRNPHKR